MQSVESVQRSGAAAGVLGGVDVARAAPHPPKNATHGEDFEALAGDLRRAGQDYSSRRIQIGSASQPAPASASARRRMG